jgi:hypothetical protein
MRSFLRSIKWTLVILALLGWLAVSLANRDFFAPLVLLPGFIEFQRVPTSLLLILPFAAAFLVLAVVGLLDQMDHFAAERELRKRVRDLEAEVAQLRNLPIREGVLNQKAVVEENRG